MDDETLMAYADGELDAAAAAQVAATAAAEPAVAARIAMFRRTRAALATHRTAPPLPDALAGTLAARIRTATSGQFVTTPGGADVKVVPLSQRRAIAWPVALAASLALAVGLGAGLRLGAPDPVASGAQVAALDVPGLGTALGTLPAGERMSLADGTELAMVASFRALDGALCREFETVRDGSDTLVAVACLDMPEASAMWDVRFALAAAADSGGYAPASSIEALEVWLDVAGMSDPLTLADEAAALADVASRGVGP